MLLPHFAHLAHTKELVGKASITVWGRAKCSINFLETSECHVVAQVRRSTKVISLVEREEGRYLVMGVARHYHTKRQERPQLVQRNQRRRRRRFGVRKHLIDEEIMVKEVHKVVVVGRRGYRSMKVAHRRRPLRILALLHACHARTITKIVGKRAKFGKSRRIGRSIGPRELSIIIVK